MTGSAAARPPAAMAHTPSRLRCAARPSKTTRPSATHSTRCARAARVLASATTRARPCCWRENLRQRTSTRENLRQDFTHRPQTQSKRATCVGQSASAPRRSSKGPQRLCVEAEKGRQGPGELAKQPLPAHMSPWLGLSSSARRSSPAASSLSSSAAPHRSSSWTGKPPAPAAAAPPSTAASVPASPSASTRCQAVQQRPHQTAPHLQQAVQPRPRGARQLSRDHHRRCHRGPHR